MPSVVLEFASLQCGYAEGSGYSHLISSVPWSLRPECIGDTDGVDVLPNGDLVARCPDGHFWRLD